MRPTTWSRSRWLLVMLPVLPACGAAGERSLAEAVDSACDLRVRVVSEQISTDEYVRDFDEVRSLVGSRGDGVAEFDTAVEKNCSLGDVCLVAHNGVGMPGQSVGTAASHAAC